MFCVEYGERHSATWKGIAGQTECGCKCAVSDVNDGVNDDNDEHHFTQRAVERMLSDGYPGLTLEVLSGTVQPVLV